MSVGPLGSRDVHTLTSSSSAFASPFDCALCASPTSPARCRSCTAQVGVAYRTPDGSLLPSVPEDLELLEKCEVSNLDGYQSMRG